MRIDCQSHIFPPEYVEILLKANGYSDSNEDKHDQADFARPITEKIHDRVYRVSYRRWQSFQIDLGDYDSLAKLRAMDKADIDLSIISVNIPNPCLLPSKLSVKGAQIINNYIADLATKNPDRFAGFASLPWNVPSAAMVEIDRIKDMGFLGVMLYPHVAGHNLDSNQFEPIYAHLAKKDLPIIFHPTVPTWGQAIKEFTMIPMIGFQVDTSFGLLRLILSGIFERYPRLKMVLPHAGGILPYMIGRIDHQTEVMGRANDFIQKPVSSYLRQNVYFDLVSPSIEGMTYALNFIGENRVLFASDSPWIQPSVFTKLVDQMKITARQRQLIYGGNCVDLFKL